MRSLDLVRGDPQGGIKKEIFNLKYEVFRHTDCRSADICDGFHQYLRIGQFVWARVLCGTRYYQYASLDCSEVMWKIHMRELEVGQGQST